MYLVDTSVWVEVFRRPAGLHLEALIPFDEVVTCLPVIQEVLQGFTDERAFQKARGAMFHLPIVESPLPDSAFLEAAGLFRLARRAGLSVRSGVDCLVAVCALRHDLIVLHRDRDFGKLARISSLRERPAA